MRAVSILILTFCVLLATVALSVVASSRTSHSSKRNSHVSSSSHSHRSRDAPQPVSINVGEYGAVGDGVHDDTEGIVKANLALLAAPGGGQLYFPQGTFVLASDPKQYGAPSDAFMTLTSSASVASGVSITITGQGIGLTYFLWSPISTFANVHDTEQNPVEFLWFTVTVVDGGSVSNVPAFSWNNIGSYVLSNLDFYGNNNYQGTVFSSGAGQTVAIDTVVITDSYQVINVAEPLQSLKFEEFNITDGITNGPGSVVILASVAALSISDTIFVNLPYAPIVTQAGLTKSNLTLSNIQCDNTVGCVYIQDISSVFLGYSDIDFSSGQNGQGSSISGVAIGSTYLTPFQCSNALTVTDTNFRGGAYGIQQSCGTSVTVTGSNFLGQGQNSIDIIDVYSQGITIVFNQNTFTNITTASMTGRGGDVSISQNTCVDSGTMQVTCENVSGDVCTINNNQGC